MLIRTLFAQYMNNDIPLIVRLLIYLTACGPHLKTMHLEPPKCAPIQIKDALILGKTYWSVTLKASIIPFTLLYITKQQTVPYILAAGTSLPPGR